MEVGSSSLPGTTKSLLGGLAQLARALAWHARGHRFDPDILHYPHYEEEIFDILTHKTVSKDFKLKTELYISINSQFTAESMSNKAACIDAIFYICSL